MSVFELFLAVKLRIISTDDYTGEALAAHLVVLQVNLCQVNIHILTDQASLELLLCVINQLPTEYEHKGMENDLEI